MTKATDINGITGEVIVRDMNEKEIEVQKQQTEKQKNRADAQIARDAARQTVLDKLGLSAHEAALLLS